MVTKLRLVFSITIAFLSFYASAQNNYWEKETSQASVRESFSRDFKVQKGVVFSFNDIAFKKELKRTSSFDRNPKVVSFPNEKGELLSFRVTEASVMSPALAAKFPAIKSYRGHSVKDKSVKIRFSVSHKGIQSMMVDSEGKGAVFMQKGLDNKYVVYNRGLDNEIGSDFICSTKALTSKSFGGMASKPVDNQKLRKFRLAVSASGEYTDHHGGTVEDAMAAINATVTRINQVFETDLGITLELIANNNEVIYTNAATDPYSNNLNTEIQNTLTSEIGEENYDVGHLFHKANGGGNAGFVGAVCVDNKKGSGYSTSENPEGDFFDIDYVAHEIGHQFGANHTWSHESEGTNVQAEPASGTTIMGYAGIVDENNVAPHSDDYFHYNSILQITEYLENVNCGEVIDITNVPPVVSDVGDFIIPKSTAFMLTGSATDVDVADILTYTWEQIDNGVVTQATFGPDNPVGANFRSRPPSGNPSRYFPKLEEVLLGNLTQTSPNINTAWETVSDVEREMNFAFTVRDNAAGGGQVVADFVKVSVSNIGGPFRVISHATNEAFVAGEVQEIIWDVANTEKAPINASSVDILLSIDGGLTFPITLASNVPNDGNHKVVLPGNPTTKGRIMVKANNNIFYAVNASEFTIQASEIVLNFANLEYGVCQPADLIVPFDYEKYLGFNEEVTFSVVSPPAGLGIAFLPEMTTDAASVAITFSDTQNLTEGQYTINVLATSASLTKQIPLTVNVYDDTFTNVVLTAPIDDQGDTSTGVMLEWDSNIAYNSYDVEVATDMAFANILESATVNTNSYLPTSLLHEVTYYWRVKPKNDCGEGVFGTAFSFTTIKYSCLLKPSQETLPLVISASGTPTVTSKISFFEDLVLSDINVNLEMDHDFLSDLVVSLTSPSGTTVVLISNSCGDLKNVNATFDDSSDDFVCNGTPAISGGVAPLGALSTFNGESILGEWVLTISDTANSDGGSLKAFSLDVCIEGDFRPDADNDGIFDDGDDLCLGTPQGAEVDLNGCPIYRFPTDNFMVNIQSESCASSNNGVVQITATLPLDYEVTITGNGVNSTTSFTNSHLLENLSSGTYNVCINGTNGTLEYVPHCFEVVIKEPGPLSVSSVTSLNGKEVTLDLNGGQLYFIELNGEAIQTESKQITLDLKKGGNSLKVTTSLPCQGVYEEQFFLSELPIVYPNPFTNITNVFIHTGLKGMVIDVYSYDGQLVMRKNYNVESTDAELDFSGLSSGVYFLKFNGPTIKMTTKVIKK